MMPPNQNLENYFKTFSKQLAEQNGFDAIGFSRLNNDSAGAKAFEAWIQQGLHGQMHYLERGIAKRKDPSLVLEHAKSLIVLASDYGKKTQSTNKTQIIARYAQIDDYHLSLGKKLSQMTLGLASEFQNFHFKGYVDTGPILEKYWASLSELGWQGKHTNLIHPKRGSYFFIACILTDFVCEPDRPHLNHCGRCEACIKICPTNAIFEPYKLDARRCIAYLTIEFRGIIPRELRSLLGNHIFGCDDCQEVCPWNRHARLPDKDLRDLEIEELCALLKLDEIGFRERFKNNPVLRAKRRGLARNICVALGNLRNQQSIPVLIGALQDDDPLVRLHAAWALGNFRDRTLLETLSMHLLNETDNDVIAEIKMILSEELLSQ